MRAMRLGAVGVTLGLAVVASPVRAAEATDVLDALDGLEPGATLDVKKVKDLLDVNIEMTYRAHAKTAKITREDTRGDITRYRGRTVEVVEFLYVEHSHQAIPRLRVGLFQDIEIFAALPMTAWEQRAGWFHPARNDNSAQDPNRKGYSTFLRDMCTYGGSSDELNGERPAQCSDEANARNTLSGNPSSWPVNHKYDVDAEGKPVAGEYTGADTDWAIDPNASEFNPQFHSIRGALSWDLSRGYLVIPKGIGDAEFGFAFSPYTVGRLNDYRDSAMPSMRIEFKYQVPSGYPETPGPLSRTMSRDRRQSALARRERLGFVNESKFDPGGVGSGLHRFSASVAMSKRLRVFDPYIGFRYTFGIPHYYGNIAPERNPMDTSFWSNVVSTNMGVEIAPLYYAPNVEEYVNLRLILGMTADYVARHRGASEMSDALHKWTYVDHYVALLGEVGLVLAVPFVTLRAVVQGGHETPHFLTGDVAGYETDGKTGLSKNEVNPHYNVLLDTPGRRVKVTETAVANGMLTLAITF